MRQKTSSRFFVSKVHLGWLNINPNMPKIRRKSFVAPLKAYVDNGGFVVNFPYEMMLYRAQIVTKLDELEPQIVDIGLCNSTA